MPGAEISKWGKALIVKIHVITGWVIPEDELLSILIDQFSKRIVESYGNVNPEEVEYAFRTYGVNVKDWGKSMNLSLVDEVMRPYLADRLEISKIEEQQANNFLQLEYKEDMSKDAMVEWFNATAKKIRAGEITVDFVPLMLYEFMDSNGSITATNEEKWEYLKRASDYRLGQLQQEVERADTINNRCRLSNFITQKTNGYFEGEEAGRVKDLAKKMCLFETILNTPE